MTDWEDRVLDLALEELHGSPGEDAEAARIEQGLRRVEQKLAELGEAERTPATSGRRAIAVAASILSLACASWFVLGRSDRAQVAETSSVGRQEPAKKAGVAPTEADVTQWIEQLSDPNSDVRDRASEALKQKGPDLVGRFREELSKSSDLEVRSRLQDLIYFWTHAVAARVNDEIITWDTVKAGFKDLRPSDITEELRQQALRAVVEERVFLQEAHRRGIVVTEAELRDAVRRNAESFGGEEAHRSALRAKGRTPEAEREQVRRHLTVQRLQDQILEQAGSNRGGNPFNLDLSETSREELRRWYAANPEKFAAVDRADVCWVEFPFDGEQGPARKTLAEAIVVKMRTKNSLGWACTEMGVKENIHIGSLERGAPRPEPFSEETKNLILDRFKFGEARVVEDSKDVILVVQLYDRTRRISETFEQAEPAVRAMFENQKREVNRKRLREGLLERAKITPEGLFRGR
jgi:hypothetical protein